MKHCATCRCVPPPTCVCGCLETSHDLPKRKGGYVRTRCNHCPGCVAYTPKEGDGVEVIVLSGEEWDEAARRTLRDLGLTYEQLAGQARAGEFSSLQARKLWLAIGRRGPT